MKAIAASVLACLALAATPALADSPSIEPLGDGFCRPTYKSITCFGPVVNDQGSLVIWVTKEWWDGVENYSNFSYHACSEAPGGTRHCVPRRTHLKNYKGPYPTFAVDKFRFTSAFPHRDPGIYKLTFWRHGKQWGQTIRLRAT